MLLIAVLLLAVPTQRHRVQKQKEEAEDRGRVEHFQQRRRQGGVEAEQQQL